MNHPTLASVLLVCIQLSFPSYSYASIDAIDGALNAMNSKSYSNNVRNFERMSQGDYSMGSKDISTSERAQKRRAMAGCKKPEVQIYNGASIDFVEKTYGP